MSYILLPKPWVRELRFVWYLEIASGSLSNNSNCVETVVLAGAELTASSAAAPD
jgi:hypothetical protein